MTGRLILHANSVGKMEYPLMRNFYLLENAAIAVGIMSLKNVCDVGQSLVTMILKMDYVHLVQPILIKSKVMRCNIGNVIKCVFKMKQDEVFKDMCFK